MCIGVYQGVGCPRTRITDHPELSCGYWELNPDLLEEQSVLLTTEPSLLLLLLSLFAFLSCHLLFHFPLSKKEEKEGEVEERHWPDFPAFCIGLFRDGTL